MGAARRVEEHGDTTRLHMARTFAGRPMYWTSVYRVGEAVVDSGARSARSVFAHWLEERGPPRVLLTTHEHEDHIGNHAILPETTRVVAPGLACAFLENGHPPFPLYRRAVWGYHERAPGARVVGEKVDVEGRSFRVIGTNGHSRDHVAYLDERENGLYAGDAYMGRFKAARLAEDVLTGLESIRRMAELDPATLFPAHGPILRRPRQKLLETVEHYEKLWEESWRLADRGFAPPRIARQLLGSEPGITWFSGGEFSGPNLVRNLLRRRPH